jgi:hypothetical protein
VHSLGVDDARVPAVDDILDKVSRSVHFCKCSMPILWISGKLSLAIVHDPPIFLYSLVGS